jgi:hypothetical protein
VKRNKRFIVVGLNCEVRLAKPVNLGSVNSHNITRRAPVTVSYNVIIRFFTGVPPQPIENILERVNHGLSSTVSVTEFESTKPLLVRLSPISRTGVSVE